jgi:hypothetical protein
MSGQETVTPAAMVLEMEWIDKVQVHQPAWIFLSLFLLLGVFAWIRAYYGNILVQTLQASANFQVASRIFMDNSLLQKQLDNLLDGFYIFSTGFMLYLVENRFGLYPYSIEGLPLYLLNLAVLAGILLTRIILLNFAGFLFNRTRLFREYLYNTFIFNKLLGVSLLPMLLFTTFTTGVIQEVFIWLTISVTVTVIVMRLTRGIIFSLRKGVSLFYMFLYLCALEIVPLTLLYKWLGGIL